MKKGKEPMRTFGDLMQFFEVATDDKKPPRPDRKGQDAGGTPTLQDAGGTPTLQDAGGTPTPQADEKHVPAGGEVPDLAATGPAVPAEGNIVDANVGPQPPGPPPSPEPAGPASPAAVGPSPTTTTSTWCPTWCPPQTPPADEGQVRTGKSTIVAFRSAEVVLLSRSERRHLYLHRAFSLSPWIFRNDSNLRSNGAGAWAMPGRRRKPSGP